MLEVHHLGNLFENLWYGQDKSNIFITKRFFGKIRKGVDYLMGVKNIGRFKKIKIARYTMTDVSLIDIYNIIKEFDKLLYEGYVQKRPKY